MTSEPGTSKSTKLSSSTFNDLNLTLQSVALKSTKLAAALPTDISFHRSVDSGYAQAIDVCSGKALSLTNKLLKLVIEADPASSRSKGKGKLEDKEDVVDSFHSVVVDVLDQLFERSDLCLDEYLGRSAAPPVSHKQLHQQNRTTTSTVPTQNGAASKLGRLDPAILHASHLPKPQLKFRRKVDNMDTSKWIPNLTHKYNAQVPLSYTFQDSTTEDGAESLRKTPHPYRYEIGHISYPQRMFANADAVPPRSFEETPFTWIDTSDGLQKLLDKLRPAKEIAVDLEHHSYRTFSGFLCLMQISTRDEDFIVDTLAIRDELEELNEIFTDPKIIKVFHGAESDIVWLQQNFSLYIVNLFDTFHASKVLDFPRHGLAALLTMYCDYVPDKRYQLADWRIRPLPTEMLDYARSDTHFLLYIYDNVRNALLDRAGGEDSLVRLVLQCSEETALRTYEKEIYDFESGSGPGGWNTLASKWNKVLSGMQLEVYKSVHYWRDRVAREEDESTKYVLPNHYLFQIAESPPADMAALLSVFRPVPSLVRKRATNLLETIRTAVKESLSPKLGSADGDKGKSPVMEVDEPEVVVRSSSNNEGTSPSTLWSSQEPNVSTTTSTLLGRTAAKPGEPSIAYLSLGSSLFSNIMSHVSKNTPASSSRYQEVVSRVHSTLVINPSVPKISVSQTEGLEDVAAKEREAQAGSTQANTAAVSGDVEIPFVPASQRKPVANETMEDTIVMVGKPKQKKRKRAKAQEPSDAKIRVEGETVVDESSQRKKSKKEADAQDHPDSPEPFDYATAPNFLDEPVREKSDVKHQTKSKGKKGKSVEYGNFPAPPRAYSEVKGGSKSHTFR